MHVQRSLLTFQLILILKAWLSFLAAGRLRKKVPEELWK